jgi:mannose-6-phosphate isomerase-like protein (cupin superfamily)
MQAEAWLDPTAHEHSRYLIHVDAYERDTTMSYFPLLVSATEGRPIQGPTGRPMIVKLDGDATLGAYSLIEYEHAEGAPGPPAHVHHEHEEAFRVIDGELTLDVDGTSYTVGPGGYAVVPRGAVHRPRNAGTVPVHFFFITSPAMDGFFVEMAELNSASGGAPSSAALVELGERWDSTFTDLPGEGPVPMTVER